jgi:hypothetical protein
VKPNSRSLAHILNVFESLLTMTESKRRACSATRSPSVTSLPLPLLSTVCGFLSQPTRLSFARVCSAFRAAAASPIAWSGSVTVYRGGPEDSLHLKRLPALRPRSLTVEDGDARFVQLSLRGWLSGVRSLRLSCPQRHDRDDDGLVQSLREISEVCLFCSAACLTSVFCAATCCCCRAPEWRDLRLLGLFSFFQSTSLAALSIALHDRIEPPIWRLPASLTHVCLSRSEQGRAVRAWSVRVFLCGGLLFSCLWSVGSFSCFVACWCSSSALRCHSFLCRN